MSLEKIINKNPEILDEYRELIVARVVDGFSAYNGLDPFTVYCLENHLMDPSTGTLRERAALWISGAELEPGQHGHDGRRGRFPIECKPRIWAPPQANSRKNNANGYGSINDHTWNRHEQYLQDHLIIQQSQFFGGICAWIIEFPYSYSEFIDHMEKHLHKASGRICGRFTYLNYWDCPGIQFPYTNRKLIEQQKLNIVGGNQNRLFFSWLMDHS